jgi:hypothetical protein
MARQAVGPPTLPPSSDFRRREDASAFIGFRRDKSTGKAGEGGLKGDEVMDKVFDKVLGTHPWGFLPVNP